MLCGRNASKAPALQSDSLTVLRGLTENNRVLVVVQNTLETVRYILVPIHRIMCLINGCCRATYIKISLPENLCVKVWK